MLHARMKHGIQCIIVSQTLQMMCTTVYLLLAKPGKRLTEDHYFMRSKTLHRDEDMLQDALKAKVATFFPAIVCIVLGRSLGTRLTQSESIDTAMSVILVWVCVLQISYYSPSLLSHFKTMDTNNSGKVSSHLLQVNKLPLSHPPYLSLSTSNFQHSQPVAYDTVFIFTLWVV